MKCHEVSHKSEHPCDINGEECPLDKVFRTRDAMQVNVCTDRLGVKVFM